MMQFVCESGSRLNGEEKPAAQPFCILSLNMVTAALRFVWLVGTHLGTTSQLDAFPSISM